MHGSEGRYTDISSRSLSWKKRNGRFGRGGHTNSPYHMLRIEPQPSNSLQPNVAEVPMLQPPSIVRVLIRSELTQLAVKSGGESLRALLSDRDVPYVPPPLRFILPAHFVRVQISPFKIKLMRLGPSSSWGIIFETGVRNTRLMVGTWYSDHTLIFLLYSVIHDYREPW
jgi:hypothetical protein